MALQPSPGIYGTGVKETRGRIYKGGYRRYYNTSAGSLNSLSNKDLDLTSFIIRRDFQSGCEEGYPIFTAEVHITTFGEISETEDAFAHVRISIPPKDWSKNEGIGESNPVFFNLQFRGIKGHLASFERIHEALDRKDAHLSLSQELKGAGSQILGKMIVPLIIAEMLTQSLKIMPRICLKTLKY
jgi:hypothetical protein